MKAAIRNLGFQYYHCVAHLINLTVQDALNKSPEIKNYLEEASDIVTYFNHHVKCQTELTNAQVNAGKATLKLIQKIDTRWNSSWEMAVRFVKVHKEVAQVQVLHPGAPDVLTAEKINRLQIISEILQTFKVSILSIFDSRVNKRMFLGCN